MTKSGWTALGVDHEDFRREIVALALRKRVQMASRLIKQPIEGFIELNRHDLWGGRLTSHGMLHPLLEPRMIGSLAAADSGSEETTGADRY